MNSKKGFTLVELLGVLVVLGLISVIIVPKVIDSITTSKEAAYQTQVETIENAAKKYGISNDLLYPKEGEKKYIAVKDLIAVGELSDKEIINPKTGNKMNGYVLVEYNSGYQQYEYTYVEEIDENMLGAMGPTYEVKDPTKWTTSKNVTIIYPKGNDKYEYEYKILAGIVDINGQEYKGETDWIATTELRKNITFKTNGSLIARVKNKDEYVNGSTLNVGYIDNTAPSAALGYDKNTLTTNRIVLVATCTDNESGISKYLFKLGNGNWIDNGTSNKYTFSNLNDSTSYDFSVECINGVGMTNQSTLNSTTSEIGAPTFIVSNPGKWETNKNVTISYPENYTRYEFNIIDGTATRNGQELTPGTWYIASSLEEVVNFTTEGTIVARVYDGTNLKYAVNQAITYVDPTKPTCEILLTGGTLGTNGYYTVAPKVQFKTSIAGGSGIYFGQSKTNSPVYDNSVTKNNSGLINITDVSDGNNTYYGFVKTGVKDMDVTSTCSKTFKVDTTKPVVAINGNASVSYANSSATITIPLKVTDLTSGIDINTFTADDITVKVGTTTVTPTKSLKYNSVSNGVYSYTLTLSGVTGNGALNLSVGAGMVVDKAGNKNNTASISTNVIIDNTAPTLEITGTNGTTYKKESNATITLKDTGGSGLTAGSYTIKYGWATSSQSCSNLTSSTTITVVAGATSGSVKVNVKGKTGAGKLYVCNSTSITDRAKNTLSANSIVSSNMYLDNEEPQIVINPNGGSYTIPVGSTSTAVRKTITVTDSTLNKSSLKYGWSSSKDVKPTMSSSFMSGTSFNDSLSGGDNYLWITASDNLSNTTTIVSNSFNVGYSVEYNANGGTTTCSVQRKEHGKNLTLCSTTPIRSGYTFAGWSDSSTATSKKYDASGTYTDNSPVKLYAVWKRTTTVTAATKSKVYDGKALTSNECSASNLASSHTVTCTNSGTITDVGSVTNSVNTVKITDSNGNDVTNNYSITKASGKLTVTKANSVNPTLTAYEGIYDATSHTFTMSGGVGGTINYSTNNGTTWTTTKPTRTTAGTTTVQVKIVGDKNHNDTSVISTTIKIDKRAITVKAAVAEKIYDGTVLTKTDGCESSKNLVSGHEAKCTNTGALLNAGSSGNTLSKVSVVSATGTDVTDNYEITKEGGRLTVKPKSVAVTWGSTTTFTYNGNAQAPTASVATGISNETMTVTRTTGTNAGSYTSTASCSSVTGGQAKCSNYTLTGNTKAFTIGAKATTITAASASKTYDGTALTKTSGCASSTNLATGHTATCTNSGTITSAGSATNTLSTVVIKDASGTDVTKNYAITKANGKLTVNKKSVAVTWGSTTTFTYNGGAQAPTASVATGISNETMSVTKTTGTNAGSYTSTASCSSVTGGQAKCSNYTLTGTTKAFTINKASSTIPTITAYEGTYDAASHTFTMSGGSGGTINYSTNNGTTWTTTKPTRTTAGTTTVQVKIVGDKNHNDTSVISTTIKIDKRAITVKAAVAEKIYDGTVLTKTDGCESSTNLVSGHEAKCTNTGALLNAGSSGNTLSKVSVVSATGADVTDNYEITKEGGRLTVKPKSLAVTWGSTTTFTYNGNAQAPTASVATGISNETMTVTRTTGTNAGSYTSTASCSSVTGGQAKCSNYTLTGNTKAFIINKVTPTIKFATTSGSVTYHTVNGFSGNWIYSPVKVSGTVTLTSSNTNYVSIQENYVSTKVDSFTSQPSSYFTIVVNGVKATSTPIPITVKFTPDNENFETVTETFNVIVNQATPTITLSEESAWLSSSKTFTEKANVAGKFTNTSGTTSVATVSPISNSTAVAANTAQTVTVTGVKDGSSTITVKFEPTDTTNYKTVSAKYTAKVDKTRPTITANGYAYSNQNGSHDSTTYNDTGDPAIHTHSSNSATSTYTYDWNNTGINFRIKFSDSGSGIKSAKWCWNDSGDYNTNTEINNCSTNAINYKQIELIAAGYRKGTFTVEDNAGNKTIYNVIVKIDKTRPTITANGYAYSNKSGSNTSTTYNDTGDPAIHTHSSNNATSSDIYDWNNTGINFRIGFSDSASGIRDARWCWDTIYSTTDPTTKVFNSTSTSKCSAGNISNYKQIDITGTGYRRGRLTVEDNAGNKTVYNVVIKIDKEEPVIKLNGSASSTSINNGSGNITIPIKITEPHSGITSSAFTASDITVKIGTTTVTPAVKSLKYNSVSNGVYSYTLTLKIGDKNVGGTVNLSIAASAIKDSVGNGNKATTLNTGVTYTTAYPTLGATATCTKTSTGYRAQISCHNCKELYYVYYNSPYPASTAALAADAKNAGTYTSRSTAGDLSKTSTYTTSSTYSRLYYGASNDKGNSVLKYVTCGS